MVAVFYRSTIDGINANYSSAKKGQRADCASQEIPTGTRPKCREGRNQLCLYEGQMLKKQHDYMGTNWENKAFGENSARRVQGTGGFWAGRQLWKKRITRG